MAEPTAPLPPVSGGPVRAAVWGFHLALPMLGLWLVLARPALDVRWEDHRSHFWLVLAVAALNVVLGLRVHDAARSHGDARLLLVALAFLASAGFLFLHALATPGVLVSGRTGGFVIATPVGLTLAAVLVAVSAADLSPAVAAGVVRRGRALRNGLLALMVVWAALSLAGAPPLAAVPDDAEVRGALTVAAVAAVALYLLAAVRYYRIHRRRPSVMLLGVITAFTLLAEAMVAVVVARNWQLSWWAWHLLMAAGFGFVAYSAHVQFRREGSAAGLFNAIASDATVARVRAEYGSALEALTSALERSEEGAIGGDELSLVTRGLAARFGLSEGQTEVLGRAARSLAAERDQGRRLAALAAFGAEAHVMRSEEDLLAGVVRLVGGAFGRDELRIGVLRDGRLQYPAELARGAWADPSGAATAALAVRGRPAGVIEWRRPGAGTGDRSILDTLAAEVSIALENVRLYSQLDTLFRQYTSPDVADALLADPSQAALGGALVEVTSLFADLRGFTSFSERSSPAGVVEVLNRYFGLAVPHIFEHGGTVLQFVGDALLAVFNVPTRQPDHALRAARAALAMQTSVEGVAAANPGWPRFRIGVNTGPALAGNIGSAELRSYNVVGDAVNVAARLEAAAEPGTVVIGAATLAAIGEVAEVTPLGPLELKGKEDRVEAFVLRSLAGRGGGASR